MTAPVPVEKTLVNIDLSKGIDERSRPELMGGITTLDNLVCDQTGAWVKRPGHVGGLASDAGNTGSEPIYPKKILPLITGWGVIADGGKLLHKQDEQDTFRTRQQLMDWNVTSASYVGSTGPASIYAGNLNNASTLAVASCTTHDALLQRGILTHGVTGAYLRVGIVERSSGVEYVYDLSLVTGGATAKSAQAVFVGDRYLHVYLVNDAGTDAYLFVIDCHGTMPATESALAAADTVVAGGTLLSIRDAVGGSTRSFVCIHDTTPSDTIYAHDASTGTQSGSAASNGDQLSLNETMTTLWNLNIGANAQIEGMDSSSLAVTTAMFATGHPGTFVSAAADNSLKILYTTTFALGGSTINQIGVFSVAAGGVVSTVDGWAYGWTPVSRPFFCAASAKHYAQMAKYDVANELSSHVICDLSTFTGNLSNSAGLANPYGSFRNACNLEPFYAVRAVGVTVTSSLARWPFRYAVLPSGYEFVACTPNVIAPRVAAAGFSKLVLSDATAYGYANFSGSTSVAHGGLNEYDGRRVIDCGFADMPITDVVVSAVAGNLNGSYRYVTVYKHVDANGNVSFSRTFGPKAATNVAGATGKNVITIAPWGITNKDANNGDSQPIVELYRTLNAGTSYKLVASSQADVAAGFSTTLVQQLAANATTGLLTVTDNLSDANLALQAVMHRQPGTTNAPADRYTAPACKFVVQHKDRLFCTDGYGLRVYYSSFFVDGESAWFNPAFNFFVHAGQGPITGLASMDGRLFVFKRDRVFVVDGDGPGEAGPTGNEFSPPQALASRYGCIDHRSIVTTPQGIFYRSSRGFELINRQLKVDWIGERVQNTSDAYPVTTGACMGPDSRIHVTVVASESASGVYDCGGVELVYDTSADAWSVGKYTGQYTGAYPAAMQSIGVIQDNGVEKIAYAEEFIGVRIADDTTGLDLATTYVPWVVETGWIKQGPQARQRISGILLLAKKHAGANHAIRISLAYDYVDSYTQVLVWEPDVLNTLAIEELLLKPETQLVLAIRVKVEEIIPSDTGTYPVGTGLGAQLLGITAEAMPMPNAPFANRGVVGQLVFTPVVAGISPATGSAAGGTAVTIYGSNFSAATTFTIGGVAVTGIAYVSPNLMTAVTGAHAAGAVDVVAINSGGTGTLSAGFTYSAGTFDPTTLVASLYLKPAYAGPTWVSTATAGSSGFQEGLLTLGSDPTPFALNGLDGADFDGAANTLKANINPETMFTRAAGGMFFLFRADTVAAGLNGYDDPTLFGDSGIYFNTSVTANGLTAAFYSGGWQVVWQTAAAATWHVGMVRWDSTDLGVTVDSAGEVSIPCGALAAGGMGASATVLFGKNALSGFFDGKLEEFMTFRYRPSVGDFANYKSYVNTTYGLAL